MLPSRRLVVFSALLVSTSAALAQVTPPTPPATSPASPIPAAGAAGAPRASNLVLNGDFETITGGGCQYNIANPSLGSVLAFATGFGSASEVDVMTGVCYGQSAVSGVTKIGLHRASPGGPWDELSLPLASPVVAGVSYTLALSVLADLSFDPSLGWVDVGLSSSPTTTGVTVFSAAPTAPDVWQTFSVTFVAPVSATHITLSAGADEAWNHVDNVILDLATPSVSSYCTAGTTSSGCVPTMTWSGTPSAGAPSGFVVQCGNVEGQRAGLMFYGVNGPNSLSWGAGSTSFLCVKSPVQRLPLQTSGGASGACNGAFANDFNTFMSMSPGALGAPFLPGTVFHLQTWFRDPPAPGTTNLSNALAFSI